MNTYVAVVSALYHIEIDGKIVDKLTALLTFLFFASSFLNHEITNGSQAKRKTIFTSLLSLR